MSVFSLRLGAICLGLLLLAACDSSEQRAEKHFQSGLQLIESGDVPRALVELRNVLALNPQHKEARMVYARTSRDMGNIAEAYANFVGVIERYPNETEARLALAQMSILAQNWEEANRHGGALIEANAGIDGQDVVELALKFRKALEDQDIPAVRSLTKDAEGLMADHQDDPILRRLLIEGYVASEDLDNAIKMAEGGIAAEPDSETFYLVKSDLLMRKGDAQMMEAHLRDFIAAFPDNDDAKVMLVRVLASEGKRDEAEAFLRAELDAASGEDKENAHVSLIAYIRETSGNDAAMEEIEAAIGSYDDPRLFQSLRAGLLFDFGQPDDAVSQMQAVVDGSEPGERTDKYKVTLAKMLLASGNEVGARTLVEEVLASDELQTEALKMSANWMIDADQGDDAVATLRRVLDLEPEDAEAMSLMARAHERNGDPELAEDLLSLAVEASNNRPDESLRYAELLISQERYSTAETVLVASLRRAPQNLQVLKRLGAVYLETADWPRAEQVEQAMRKLPNEVGRLPADNLRLQVISRREGRDQGVQFLEDLAQDENVGVGAKLSLISALLSENNPDGALALAQEIVTEFPDSPEAQLVLGSTQLSVGAFSDAETTLRGVVEETNDPRAVLQLLRALSAQGHSEEATIAIDAALERAPKSPDLLWAKASFLERANQFDDAIAIYEQLYEINSNSLVVANNLASLLATYRDDQESLDRAFTVGRRLRGTDFAPFQDTYGWILYRRGNIEEALTYLAPAATVLSKDPIVQYHLGKAYVALGQTSDALRQFQNVVELAGENDPRGQIADAKAEIEKLSNP